MTPFNRKCRKAVAVASPTVDYDDCVALSIWP